MGKLILTGYVDAKSHCARERNCTSFIQRYLTRGLKVSPATSVHPRPSSDPSQRLFLACQSFYMRCIITK